MSWIDVNNRMPSELHLVMFFIVNTNGIKAISTGYLRQKTWMHTGLFCGPVCLPETINITHWMPLPRFPSENPCAHQILYLKHVYHCEKCGEYVERY